MFWSEGSRGDSAPRKKTWIFSKFGLYKRKSVCYHPYCSGPVVQSVSTPACHAGGRRFESVPGRQKENHSERNGFSFSPEKDLNHFHASVRRTLAGRRLDGGHTLHPFRMKGCIESVPGRQKEKPFRREWFFFFPGKGPEPFSCECPAAILSKGNLLIR